RRVLFRSELIRQLLEIRHREIVPRLSEDLHAGRYELAEGRAFRVEWPLADGTLLHLIAHLAAGSIDDLDWTLPGRRLFASPDFPATEHITTLPPWSVAWSCG